MKNREKLYKLIDTTVIRGIPELQVHVEQQLVREGRLPKVVFDKFVRGSMTLDFFDVSVLVWFAEALESFDDRICKVVNHFEDVEVLNAKMYVYPDYEDLLDDHLILHNVIQLAPNQYLAPMSVNQIAILSANNVLKVNAEAQRDSIVRKFGEAAIRVIKMNPVRINSIAKKIANNKYFFNDIRINVVKDSSTGMPMLDFNPNKCTIKIKTDDLIIIPDGNHRVKGCEVARTKYPEKVSMFDNLKFAVLITNETILGCKAIVEQEWNREPVSTDQIKSMKRTDANFIVEMLISSETADPVYSQKIVRTHEEIKNNNGYVLMPLFSDAIDWFYTDDTMKSMAGKQNLKQWLEQFLNHVAFKMYDDFENYSIVKQRKWSVLPEAFVFYVYLSSLFKNNNNWQQQVDTLLKKVEWNIESNPYKGMITSKRRMINATIDLYNSLND